MSLGVAEPWGWPGPRSPPPRSATARRRRPRDMYRSLLVVGVPALGTGAYFSRAGWRVPPRRALVGHGLPDTCLPRRCLRASGGRLLFVCSVAAAAASPEACGAAAALSSRASLDGPPRPYRRSSASDSRGGLEEREVSGRDSRASCSEQLTGKDKAYGMRDKSTRYFFET
jgi:hypothetical protein